MDELVKKTDDKPCPYPVPINNLHDLLSKAIKKGIGFKYVYALRRNIAYNLQYLEFLDRCMCDLKMSGVVSTIHYKVFILIGCSIIEALIHYLLIKNNRFPRNPYELEYIVEGTEQRRGGKFIKIDNHIYKKLSKPTLKEIQFNTKIDIVKNRKILGGNKNLYPRLNFLRKLRNKIHLHLIEDPTDHDWNRFSYDKMCAMAEVIHSIFTSGIFIPSNKEKEYFNYLKKYFEEQS